MISFIARTGTAVDRIRAERIIDRCAHGAEVAVRYS
jgi:hypothetical protein